MWQELAILTHANKSRLGSPFDWLERRQEIGKQSGAMRLMDSFSIARYIQHMITGNSARRPASNIQRKGVHMA